MKVLVHRNRMKVALFMLNLLILYDTIDMSDLNGATNPGLILGQPIKTIVNHRGNSFRNKQTRVNKSNLIAIAPITVLKACSNRIDVGYKQNRFINCVNKNNLVQIKRVSSRNFTALALINARSLKANSEIINDFILDKNTPIVAFTETWIKNNNSNICFKDITPDHSVFLQVDRPASLGGGVALMCPKATNPELCEWFTSSAMEIMLVQLSSDRGDIKVCVIYRPPSSNYQIFFEEFSQIAQQLSASSVPFIILGDLNIHVDTSGNLNALRFLDILDNFNLLQHVSLATHIGGHTLDLIITSAYDNVLKGTPCVSDLISDYFAVECNIELQKKCEKKIKNI